MLKLSKKADYALMALQYMAMVRSGETSPFNPNRVVNTKEIAEEHHIPLELLAKVLQTLAKYDMVESQNGPKGGYLLAREPRELQIVTMKKMSMPLVNKLSIVISGLLCCVSKKAFFIYSVACLLKI